MTQNILQELNPIEQLEACNEWFNSMHADLSFALRSPEDALKLWRYAIAHPELAEFCDEPSDDFPWLEHHFIEAIGYNPWHVKDNPWQTG